MEGRAPCIDPVVDARDHHVGSRAEALDAGQDDGERRWALDAEGGNVGQAGDLDRLEGDRLPLVDRPHGGPGPAVVGQRSDHEQLVVAAEAGRQTTGQGGDARREDAVVVGDEDAHTETFPSVGRGPGGGDFGGAVTR